MERLIIVACPELAEEDETGAVARVFAEMLRRAGELCPWIEPVRLGVVSLPARGPSRFFGGEETVVSRLRERIDGIEGVSGAVDVGIADGLFAALLAARSSSIVASGESARFLAPHPVAVLARMDLAVTLQRLGIHTLGQFAALEARHVLARFGTDASLCHRVARGEIGELEGLRDRAILRRLSTLEEALPTDGLQPDFFGGAAAGDRRAARCCARLQTRYGPGCVQVARVRGGRDPRERGVLVPWGSDKRALALRRAPWPGRLPSPSPVVLVDDVASVEVLDVHGRPVYVSGRGLISAAPDRWSLNAGPWRTIELFAGPWPTDEHWWLGSRRRARMQILSPELGGVLLMAEGSRWWVEGYYE